MIEDKKYEWLPHLENSLPESAKGYSISQYAIALEGWRRGLHLRFINSFKFPSEFLYELSSDTNKHEFRISKGDYNTLEGRLICKDKYKTKKYLQKSGVPTPQGKSFKKATPDERIIEYAEASGYPLVIKPVDGTGGHGVIAGINNSEEFARALKIVRQELGFKAVIVEDYFKGDDYRIYVIGEDVIGAMKRIPANIIGDGNSSIQKLIKEKNLLREKDFFLGASLIEIDSELEDLLSINNYSLSTILTKGERLFLKSKNNISSGGDSIDVTDEISDEIKKIAVDGLRAIPGILHAGVDLLVNEESDEATIIEINSGAHIRSQLFPMEGKARDIPSKLIDLYFPETKDIPRQDLFYFDLKEVRDLFIRNITKEFIIPDLPSGKVLLKEFTIEMKNLKRKNLAIFFTKAARQTDVHGYLEFTDKEKAFLVVGGEEEKIQRFEKRVFYRKNKIFDISIINECLRTEPIKIGFEVIETKARKNKKIKPSASRARKATTTDYKKKYEAVVASTSWKITKPIRRINKFLKKK